jgi:hypothetical protein
MESSVKTGFSSTKHCITQIRFLARYGNRGNPRRFHSKIPAIKINFGGSLHPFAEIFELPFDQKVKPKHPRIE